MAWTAPETFTAGQTLSAASMNLIQANINAGCAAAASVYLSADVGSYTSGTDIDWSATLYDTDSMWDAGDPERLTVNTAGLYLVQSYIYLSCTATLTAMNVQWHLYAADYDAGVATFGAKTSTTAFGALSDVFAFSAGDYVSIRVNPGGGSSYTINGSASAAFDRSRFSMTWLGQAA